MRSHPLLVVLIATAGCGSSREAAPSTSPVAQPMSLEALSFKVERPHAVFVDDHLPDSVFHAIYDDNAGQMQALVSGGETRRMVGPDLEHLSLTEAPVINKGTPGNFDSCGAWLQAMERDGAVVRGFYHAEEKCTDYRIEPETGQIQTHKSIAYAESYDGGKTFVRPNNYPDNQILTGGVPLPKRTTGVGDQTVIRQGDQYYLFYLDSNDYRTKVARAAVSDGGRPGTWWKWYAGAWSEPGLGGLGTPLGSDYMGVAISEHSPSGQWVLPLEDPWFGGVKLSYARDLASWSRFPEPLVPIARTNWDREYAYESLVGYPSILAPMGGRAWEDRFYLFYMYLPPHDRVFKPRWLVRQELAAAPATPDRPRVTLALSRYHAPAIEDFWTTTAVPIAEPDAPADYLFVDTIGYIMTAPQPGTQELLDCYIPEWRDHMIDLAVYGEEELFERPVMSQPRSYKRKRCKPGIQTLRTLGWVWSEPRPGTVPIHRCFAPSTTNHFVSDDPSCEGRGDYEFVLGYVYPPTFGRQTTYRWDNGVHNVVSGDFDADGYGDLGVTGHAEDGDRNWYIRYGDGHGGFGRQTVYQWGNGVTNVFSADFDGDGYADIGVTGTDNDWDRSWYIRYGDGQGGFGRQTVYHWGNGATRVIAGDFNGDRFGDIGVVDLRGTNAALYLRYGDGAGQFGGQTVHEWRGPSGDQFLAADFNGDDLADLAATSSIGGSFRIRLNDGAGGFGPTEVYDWGNGDHNPFAGDFDRDGKGDLGVTGSRNAPSGVFYVRYRR